MINKFILGESVMFNGSLFHIEGIYLKGEDVIYQLNDFSIMVKESDLCVTDNALNVYIKGIPDRGQDVIKELESRGGVNKKHYEGNDENCIYYIDYHNKEIDLSSLKNPNYSFVIALYHPIKPKVYSLPTDYNEWVTVQISNGTQPEPLRATVLANLMAIRDEYNKGCLRFNKEDELVYSIVVYKGGNLIIETYTSHWRSMSFKTKELAEEFLKNFRKELEFIKELI